MNRIEEKSLENESDFVDIINQIDDAIVLLSTKNRDVDMFQLSALILSRLMLINEAMNSEKDFNALMLHAINRKIDKTNQTFH